MERQTHPTAGTQKQTSPSPALMSRTPDRHPPEGPAASEAQRGPMSGGPRPDRVCRAPGPSTSCLEAGGGALPATVTPQSPWSVGSPAARCVVNHLYWSSPPSRSLGHSTPPPPPPSPDLFLDDGQAPPLPPLTSGLSFTPFFCPSCSEHRR